MSAIALAAVREFYRLTEKMGYPVAKTVGLAASGLVLGAAALRWGPIHIETAARIVDVVGRTSPAWWYGASLAVVFAASAAPLIARVAPSAALAAAASTVFGVLAIALPATAMCYLRAVSPRAVLLLLLLVWVCDSCAYYFGRRFGRHPLAPVVSPRRPGRGRWRA